MWDLGEGLQGFGFGVWRALGFGLMTSRVAGARSTGMTALGVGCKIVGVGFQNSSLGFSFRVLGCRIKGFGFRG